MSVSANMTDFVLLDQPPDDLDSPSGGFGLPPPNMDDDLDELEETESGRDWNRSGTLTESIIQDITADVVQYRRKQSRQITPRKKGYSQSKNKQKWSQINHF